MDDLYIGLMSGTSIDGIDACLIDLTNKHFKLIESHFQPYPEDTKYLLTQVIKEKKLEMHHLARLDHELASLNSQAVNDLLKKANYESNRIKAVGYHGQTIFHEPDGRNPNSIQLGDPNVLVQQTGITTVADIRRMDMAAGGQGAPLAPAFHQFLFHDANRDRVILNIGGIANITILPADSNRPVIGFDTGPGNCLLDEWSLINQHQPYDKNGLWAKQGQLQENILGKLINDPYFAKPIPKSTGREYFHLNWLKQNVDTSSVDANDLQTTLTHLTVSSISEAILKYAPLTDEVYVCGGGAHNKFLLSLLQEKLEKIQVDTTAVLGLDPDWVEACAFAWFARQRLEEHVANLPSVTGASKLVLLGAIYHS